MSDFGKMMGRVFLPIFRYQEAAGEEILSLMKL